MKKSGPFLKRSYCLGLFIAALYTLSWSSYEQYVVSLSGAADGGDAVLYINVRDGIVSRIYGRVAGGYGRTFGKNAPEYLRIPDEYKNISTDFVADGQQLKGSFDMFVGCGTENKQTYALDATVQNGALSGSYTGAGTSGSLSGTYKTEAELKAENAVAEEKNWPVWQGPNGNFSGAVTPGGPDYALVDKLSDARLAWVGEDIPANTGTGGCRYEPIPNGGNAGPIVSDGKVFLNFYYPTGSGQDGCVEGRKPPPPEWQLADAHDVVVALDAATGKTVWRQIHANKGMRYMNHKTELSNNTMAADGENVYAMGATGLLYSMDKHTGQLEWEIPFGGGYHDYLMSTKEARLEGQCEHPPGGRGSGHGLSIADGVLLACKFGGGDNSLFAVDAATSDSLWLKSNLLANRFTPTKWAYQGTEYFITVSDNGIHGTIHCIEPRTGRIVWEKDSEYSEKYQFILNENYLILHSGSAYRITDEGATFLWNNGPGDVNGPVGTILGGFAYMRYAEAFSVVDIETGEIIASLPQFGGGGEANVWAMDDRILLEMDSQHGHFYPYLIDAHPYRFTQLGQQWHGLHLDGTGYEVPYLNPVADGRLFVRGADGIYCYDLRKDQMPLKISMTAPSSGHTMLTTEKTTLKASISEGSVSQVTFMVNGEQVGVDNESPWEIEWGSSVRGLYHAYAVASGVYSDQISINVRQAPCENGPSAVSAPLPANGERDVSPFMRLQWTSPQTGVNVATSYILYFGDAENPPAVDTLNGIDSTDWWGAMLQGATTYYWRVDAVNDCGVAQGEEWSFVTRAFDGFRYLRFDALETFGLLNSGVNELVWLEGGSELPSTKMSSNEDGGMRVWASEGSDAYLIYDGNQDTYFSVGNAPVTVYLDLGAGSGVLPDQARVLHRGATRALTRMALYGSEDGESWVKLFEDNLYGDNLTTVDLVPSVEEPPVNASMPHVIAKPAVFEARPIFTASSLYMQVRLPFAQELHLEIFSLDGRLIARKKAVLNAGIHALPVADNTGAEKVMIWRIRTAGGKCIEGKIVGLRDRK